MFIEDPRKHANIEGILAAHGVGSLAQEEAKPPRSVEQVDAIIADVKKMNEQGDA